MPFEVHPCTHADIPEWGRIQAAAFGNGPDDFMFATRPYSEESRAILGSERVKLLSNPHSFNFKVIDTDIDHTIGIAQWMVYENERTEAELDESMVVPQIPEFDQPAVNAFFANLYMSRKKEIGTRPHVSLNALVVDPEFQRKEPAEL